MAIRYVERLIRNGFHIIRQGGEMMMTEKLNGVKVITADSYKLGEVEGSKIDTKMWKITHLNINLDEQATRDLGFKKPFLGSVSICLPVEMVAGFGNVISLNKSLVELRNMPECKA